ncbi:MAG: hypothetical protein GC171_05570 [Terrimonas sp.]|nr:hypothetical protein [Terrimonas sp.]
MGKYRKLIWLSFVLLCQSCHTYYRPQQLAYTDYTISAAAPKDSDLHRLLQPYADTVNSRMNAIVGYCRDNLEKARPNFSLGNFMADAMLVMGTQHFATQIDAAFVNYGGVRLEQLPVGPVTRSKIFELMPFDNILVIQQLKGAVLMKLLDYIAGQNGWPLAGITMKIRDHKAFDILIGGKPLNPDATYVIANSDFVVNGGEIGNMLKGIPVANNGYLVRDALFDYIGWLQQQGRDITITEKRIHYAE